MRRPSRTDPQRVLTCCRCFLPDLTGFTGFHRAGLDPDDTLVPPEWKLGLLRLHLNAFVFLVTKERRLIFYIRERFLFGEQYSERDYVGHPCPPPFRPPLCGVRICCPANSSNPNEGSQILFILEFFKWIADAIRLKNWRRERDSNPRYAFTYTRFPGVLLQPLRHLSVPLFRAADSTAPLICPQGS